MDMIQLPSGERIKNDLPLIVSSEERFDAMASVLGNKLLPNDRRSFQFAPRTLGGVGIAEIEDPYESLRNVSPDLRAIYDD
jgi:hypothetical protein